jgi:hypothetical protein
MAFRCSAARVRLASIFQRSDSKSPIFQRRAWWERPAFGGVWLASSSGWSGGQERRMKPGYVARGTTTADSAAAVHINAAAILEGYFLGHDRIPLQPNEICYLYTLYEICETK